MKASLEAAPLSKLGENPEPASAAKNKLDFLIVGAAKSGTTSLHRYLESHPQLYLLPEKEVPYFSNDEYRAQGWEWYLNEFFIQAPAEKLWGKSTPQYMSTAGVAEKIHAQLPKVKLIALLRNPVDRAYSHYKMGVKRQEEQRTFVEALNEMFQNLDVPEPANAPDENLKQYVGTGEYGRILADYLRFFPREQLLVLFTEDLKKDPKAVLKRVLRFLEVDDGFVPRNLGKQYHVGGIKRRIPVDEHVLAKHRFFRKALEFSPGVRGILLSGVFYFGS